MPKKLSCLWKLIQILFCSLLIIFSLYLTVDYSIVVQSNHLNIVAHISNSQFDKQFSTEIFTGRIETLCCLFPLLLSTYDILRRLKQNVPWGIKLCMYKTTSINKMLLGDDIMSILQKFCRNILPNQLTNTSFRVTVTKRKL